MKGTDFVIDDSGRQRAVLIDLDEWGEIWEDFYDALIAFSRKDEPTLTWEDLKEEMD